MADGVDPGSHDASVPEENRRLNDTEIVSKSRALDNTATIPLSKTIYNLLNLQVL